MPFFIGAAIAGAGVLSSVVGASSAGKAADASKQASDAAVQQQQEQYQQTRSDLLPYNTTGQSASNRLAQIFGLSGGVPAPAPSPVASPAPSFAPGVGASPGGGLPQGWQIIETDNGGGGESGPGSPISVLLDDQGNIATTLPAGAAGQTAAQQWLQERGLWQPAGGLPGGAAYQPQQQQPTQMVNAGALPGSGSAVAPYAAPNNGLFDMSVEALRQTPGYQFAFDEGMRGVNASAAARGNALSGAAIKAAARFGTGLADNTYQTQEGIFGNNVNRSIALNDQYYTRNISPLFDLAKMGANAGAVTGQIGADSARSSSQAIMSAGQTGAAARVAQGQAITNGVNGIANNTLYAAGRGWLGNFGGGSAGGSSWVAPGGWS